ncbi:MAG: glycosyltransferase [Candidatus Bathyarchaeota archaeon]
MTEMADPFCPSLAVVVAAYNEEEGIAPTLSELHDVLNETYLVVVDGKSTDRTIEFAKGLGAEVIIQCGKGKGDAILMLEWCLETDLVEYLKTNLIETNSILETKF